MFWTGTTLLGSALALLALASLAVAEDRAGAPVRLAQAPHGIGAQAPVARNPPAPLQVRFPQPVRVGDLIGLPVLDDDDSTLGRVREVVRDPQGRIRLIVSYSRWWGI